MTRRPRGIVVVAAALAAVALIASGTAVAASHLNLLNVESQFMCTSCHEPLVVVSSPQAINEKNFIQGLIAHGDNIQQIRAAMVNAYGVEVLARPPASGFNLLVYILPPALLVGGLALLAYTLPKWRDRARRSTQAQRAVTPPLSGDDAARLDDELTKFI